MRLILMVKNLCRENAPRFEEVAGRVFGVRRADTWNGRAEFDIADESVRKPLVEELRASGFLIDVSSEHSKPPVVLKVNIDGMTCRSCEVLIERSLKAVPGIKKVDADAGRGLVRVIFEDGASVPLEKIEQAVNGEKYRVRGVVNSSRSEEVKSTETRPTFLRLIGLFAIVILVGKLLDWFGVFGQNAAIGGSVTFAAAVLIGLVAGSSSCLAVSGGLMLGSAGAYHRRYANISGLARMRPVFLFVAGRIVFYGAFGGVIGILGSAVTFSPLITGSLTTLAAFYMVIMGLDMLHIAPVWLKRFLPRLPKSISRKIVDAEGKEHPAAPFLLGAATFFLPCGFTQSLQVFALTTGSFFASASVLAGFAIGTAPALLALGWASSSLKGKAGKWFFQFSGALVIVLGLWNIQNGLTVAGYPIALPKFSIGTGSAAIAGAIADDPNVVVKDNIQLINLKLINQPPFYSPSNSFTVQAGLPVRMVINSRGLGCRTIFQIPQLRVSAPLNQNVNIVEFTPSRAGTYTFSCSMGMYRGTLRVIES